MTDQSYVYAGVGWWRGGTRGGVFRLDLADGEVRHLTHGLPEETHVQAVTLHPENPEIVYIGTQDGPYQGRPATGKKLLFSTADFFRMENGKFAEHWDVVDSLPRAVALGLVPAPNPPSQAAPKSP